MSTSESLGAVVDALRSSGPRLLVASHPSPDGDAIGSTVAALLALEQLKLASSGSASFVAAYNTDPVPRRYEFLRGAERITREVPEGLFDATLLVDCCDMRLFTGTPLPRDRLGTLIVVDHHRTPCQFGDVVLQDPSAAAVGVLLYAIFRELGLELTDEISEALFCSIMSDTGSFRYQNTNCEAMRVAGDLLDRGIDPWRVASHIYEDRPRCELELLARVLGTLEVSQCGRAASLTVTSEMLGDTGCTPDVVDGFINYARGVQGVEVAILFWPGPAGVRVSLRSRGSVDVSRLAERFGGGGHRNAAGFRAQADLVTVRAEVFEEVGRMLGPST